MRQLPKKLNVGRTESFKKKSPILEIPNPPFSSIAGLEEEFQPASCGCRRGNPLSPFLFLHCYGVLSTLIDNVSSKGLFESFKAGSDDTHLYSSSYTWLSCKYDYANDVGAFSGFGLSFEMFFLFLILFVLSFPYLIVVQEVFYRPSEFVYWLFKNQQVASYLGLVYSTSSNINQ